MDYRLIALLVSGGLILFIGNIMILVAAFRESIGWGLVSLFVPFGNLVYVVCHWAEAKAGFLASVFGGLMMIGGLFGMAKSDEFQKIVAMQTGVTSSQSSTDLTTEINDTRIKIERLEGEFNTMGVNLAQQYQALNAQRGQLKPGDSAAVEKFNAQAADYQGQNSRHKAKQQELEATRSELSRLLSARSEATQLEKASTNRQ